MSNRIGSNLPCSNCGAAAKVSEREHYHFRESGLPHVFLKNIHVTVCPQCGNEDPIIAKPEKLMTTIARAVAKKPAKLSGEEFRFLRKHLDLSGIALAEAFHVTKETVSRWENNREQIGDTADRLIRALVFVQERRGSSKGAIEIFRLIGSAPLTTEIDVDAESEEYVYA